MNNIDWSKAPAWATHYGPESDCYCESWYQVIDGKIVTFAGADSAVCVPQPASQGECFYHPIEELVARWLGEGLPPVGAVCEAWYDDGRVCWHQADVVGHNPYEPNTIAVSLKGDHERKLIWSDHFRPLRTPEQIAEEERQKALDVMVAECSLLDKGWSRLVCAGLYDAGYRRVEQ